MEHVMVSVSDLDEDRPAIKLEQGEDLIMVERREFREMMARLNAEGQRLGWVAE